MGDLGASGGPGLSAGAGQAVGRGRASWLEVVERTRGRKVMAGQELVLEWLQGATKGQEAGVPHRSPSEKGLLTGLTSALDIVLGLAR